MILLKLFVCFLQIGLFSVGGGYAAMPLIQNQVVDLNGWLTMAEFSDLVTIAEMTPGPILINAATFVGIRIAGIPGAVIASVGSVIPSMVIASLLAYIYFRYRKMSVLQSVLGCLRPAVVALIASAGLSILSLVAFGEGGAAFANIQWGSIVLFAAAFFVLRKYKPNPILVMCLCGAGGLVLGMLGIA
ncbi:MAG: chromate transporter [Clostridiales bacterium]|nr:chromate transporter [Clostridiales bacterium]